MTQRSKGNYSGIIPFTESHIDLVVLCLKYLIAASKYVSSNPSGAITFTVEKSMISLIPPATDLIVLMMFFYRDSFSNK